MGNRLTASDASGTIAYQYDSRNRLILETKPDGSTLAYDYDAAGNKVEVVTTAQISGSAVTLIDTHTYDALNRLATTTDSGFNTTGYGYDAVGNRASVSHPNGNVTEYSYDSLNRLTDISVYNGLAVLVDQFSYTLHATGRREVITELSGRVSSYSYDDLYRLTSEAITDAVNGNHNASYVYDAVGNRTQSTVNGVTTGFSYDDNDRLTSAGGDSWSYDANGNTVSQTVDGVTTSYDYDDRNRLAGSTTGGVTTSYSYDVNGIRTGRSSGGSSTNFIVDHNQAYAQVVAEITDGAFARGYSFGDDLISQVFPGGSVFFYHYDGLGSTRSLSDATGLFTDEYDYEAFGELTGSAGSTENSYLFAGEQFDSGLGDYYLRARYYDQGVGRFTQMDSFQGFQNDPQSLHKYNYANLDPVSYVDPTGYFSRLNDLQISQKIQSELRALEVTANLIGISSIISNSRSLTELATAPERASSELSLGLAKVKVRQCAKGGTAECNAGIPILLHGADLGELTRHISDALFAGKPSVLSKRGVRHPDAWRASVPECKGRSRTNQCDEYPFGISDQGGPGNYVLGGVSLRLINGTDNSRGGNRLKRFFVECQVSSSDQFNKWFGVLAFSSVPTTTSLCTRQ